MCFCESVNSSSSITESWYLSVDGVGIGIESKPDKKTIFLQPQRTQRERERHRERV